MKFESKPNMTEYHVTGDLFQYEVERTNPSKFYPTDFAMSPDPSVIEDSILSAKMLAGAARNELQGFKARCRFLCKSTIGCDHFIPKNSVSSTTSYQARNGLQTPEVLRTLRQNMTFRTGINFSPISQSPSSQRMERVRRTFRAK